jgi:hypothetical protein
MTQRRVEVIVAAGIVLLATTDFLERIWVPRHTEVRPAASFAPATVIPPPDMSRIRQDLASWLPKLHPISEGAGPAGEQDWSLTLLAVFDDRNARFAVIRATPAAGGAGKLQRVAEGDQIFGYEVARVEPLAVALKGQGGDQELRLFKPGAVGASGAAPTPPASPASSNQPVAGAQSIPAGQRNPAGPVPASDGRVSGAGAAAAPGPATVDMKALKAGDPAQLPESMRGLKLVVTPAQPQKNAVTSATKPAGQAPRKP